MDKFWHRNWFSRPQTPEEKPAETAQPAPDDGNAEVQFSRGLKFANGEGSAQDYLQAAEWYRKAAGQNHCLAQFNLGIMNDAGQGMPRDDVQAMVWFDKAARQGDAGAQFHLGRSHYRASVAGLPQDASESRIEAYKWYQLAAAQGYKGSETASMTLTFRMTREDVADGGRRAAAFVSAKSSDAPSPEGGSPLVSPSHSIS